MGTANFPEADGARKIFSVDNDYEFSWEDTRMDVASLMEEKVKDKKFSHLSWYQSDTYKVDNNRSYGSTSIGDLTANVGFLNLNVDLTLRLKTTSGYYSGFILDYEVFIELQGGNREVDDFIEDVVEYPEDFDINKGLIAIHKKRLREFVDDLVCEMQDFVEEVYSPFSDELEVFASFSNGETIYVEAESKDGEDKN